MGIETDGFAFVLPSRNGARCWVLAESEGFNLSLALGRATAIPTIEKVMNGLNGEPVCLKLIGELINEDQITLGAEESKGSSIKGHYPKEDGVIASRLQAETAASRHSIGSPIARRIGVTLKRVKNQ